jgi:esterase/lipase superfamily enzyme
MENTKELFDGLIQTTISEALLADAIELYADQEIQSEGDREDFVEKYSDELYQPMIRKAVLDVVVAIVSAFRVDSDEAFQMIVNMLDVEEQDDTIRQMKKVMLDKMIDDAVSDLSDAGEKQFRLRMAYVERNLG